MKYKGFLSKTLTVFVVIALLGISNVQAATISKSKISRVSGQNRIITAGETAINLFGTAQNVILVNGYGYADSMSATPLSKQLDAPILLTAGKTLEPEVISTIEKLSATNVYIVGGTGVVSSNVENQLSSMGLKVERLAGTTDTSRFGTNAVVAEKVLKLSGKKTAMVVNAVNGYYDALVVASLAAQNGYPVLYSTKTQMPQVVKSVLDKHSIRLVYSISSGDSLTTELIESLKTKERESYAISNKNKYYLCLDVIKSFEELVNLDATLNFNKIYIASAGINGDQFADGLIASAAAAKTNSVLFLTGGTADNYEITLINHFIRSRADENCEVKVIGGESSVSNKIIENLIDSTPYGEDIKISSDKKKIIDEAIKFINDERVKLGFKPVKMSDTLQKVAMIKAEQLNSKGTYYNDDYAYADIYTIMDMLGVDMTPSSTYYMGPTSFDEFINGTPYTLNRYAYREALKKDISEKNLTDIGIGLAGTSEGGYMWVFLYADEYDMLGTQFVPY